MQGAWLASISAEMYIIKRPVFESLEWGVYDEVRVHGYMNSEMQSQPLYQSGSNQVMETTQSFKYGKFKIKNE